LPLTNAKKFILASYPAIEYLARGIGAKEGAV